jgi:hypothetical protein
MLRYLKITLCSNTDLKALFAGNTGSPGRWIFMLPAVDVFMTYAYLGDFQTCIFLTFYDWLNTRSVGPRVRIHYMLTCVYEYIYTHIHLLSNALPVYFPSRILLLLTFVGRTHCAFNAQNQSLKCSLFEAAEIEQYTFQSDGQNDVILRF